MRIIQAHKIYYSLGGAEKIFLKTIHLLRQHGHCIYPFASRSFQNHPCEYQRFFPSAPDFRHIHNEQGLIHKLRIFFRMLYNYESAHKMSQLIRYAHPDLIHVHMFLKYLTFAPLQVAKEYDIPVIYHAHDYRMLCQNGFLLKNNNTVCSSVECSHNKYYRCVLSRCIWDSSLVSGVCALEGYLVSFMRIYKRYITRMICVSNFSKSLIEGAGVFSGKIDVVPNFVEVQCEPNNTMRGDYILYFGRLSKGKGLDTLIDAAALLPSMRFMIVGDGEYGEEVKKKIEQRGLANIEMQGFKKEKKLIKIIQQARFSVTPSIHYENFALTVLESLACAKAVIASNIGAIPEIITDGYNGLLFTPGKSVELAEKITYLWNNPTLAADMGYNGFKLVKEKYTPGIYYDRLMTIYNQVLNR